MPAPKEDFKQIKGTNYKISDFGNVINDKSGKILKRGVNTEGYAFVNLKGKSVKIHRLVALYFIPNENELNVVNHKVGDKLNNSVTNLEWCTQSYNLKHAYSIGLKKPVINVESKNGFSKKVKDTNTGKIFDSVTQVIRIGNYGIKYSTLKSMLNGQNPNYTTLKYV